MPEPRPLLELLGFLETRERVELELRARTGNAIRSARESSSVSQSDLSRTLGVTRSYLSQIENGHKAVSTPQLRNIYSALETTAQTGGSNAASQGSEAQGFGTAKADAAKARKRP